MATYFDDDEFYSDEEANEERKYENFFNSVMSRRKINYVQEVGSLLSCLPPDKTYNFSNGDLNPWLNPFTSINVDLFDGSRFSITRDELRDTCGVADYRGYKPLRDLLRKFTDSVHGNQDWIKRDILLTCGSQDSMFKIFNTCLSKGDAVIVPVPVHEGTKDILKLMNVDMIQCEFDQHGPCITFMESMLHSREKLGRTMPKVMYVNPTGINPTGLNYSNRRKRELYRLACRYNFIILEDDPYYFINFDESEKPRSFLSMDIESRVIRLDSFSKMVGVGFRIGFIIAPKQITEKLALYQQISSFPSTIVCIMLYCTIITMGLDGFKEHLNRIKEFYRRNRDHLLRSLEKHLNGVAEWTASQGAMFIWVKVKNVKRISQNFIEKCWKKLVLPCPGFVFYVDDSTRCPYIKLNYSSVMPDRIDEGIRILSQLIREEVTSTYQQ